VEVELAGLSQCCERMTAALEASQMSTSSLLYATEALQAELGTNARREALVTEFLEKYQLAPSEVVALREGEVATDVFYAALARVADIHDNCRQLLRRHHQRAGLELMDAMALYQESAYERLCRFVQAQCRALGEAEVPELPPALAKAMTALRARPALRRHAAEEAASGRQQALFGRFLTALTRGGPGGVPRPMEAHAHDPRRYVGDMCAWLHQACAGERELMRSLLDDAQPAEASAPPGAAEDGSSVTVDATWALDRVFEGVCRPFKLRVEAALGGIPPAALVLAFQLTQLLGFYTSTLASLVGEGSVLTITLAECHTAAKGVLRGQLASRKEKLARFPPSPEAPNVGAAAAFVEAAARCGELLAAADAAVGPIGRGADGSDVGAVLDALITPLLDSAKQVARNLERAPEVSSPWVGAAYVLNCLTLLQQPLSGRSAGVDAIVALLASTAEQYKTEQVAAEVRRVLAACGLAPFFELAAAGGAAPGSPALAPSAVGPALEALYARLTSASPLPDFKELQQPRDRSEMSHRIATQLADAYATVYDAVCNAHPGAALRHSSAQVRTVCDGL